MMSDTTYILDYTFIKNKQATPNQNTTVMHRSQVCHNTSYWKLSSRQDNPLHTCYCKVLKDSHIFHCMTTEVDWGLHLVLGHTDYSCLHTLDLPSSPTPFKEDNSNWH